MDKKIIGRLSDLSAWGRFALGVIFMIVNNFTQNLLILTGLVQYIFTFVTGYPNYHIQEFATSLSKYGYHMTRYYNLIEDEKPFPFNAWPK